MAQVARDEDAPLPPPRDHSPDDDFLRIEHDGWYNDEEEDEDRSSDNEDKENRDR